MTYPTSPAQNTMYIDARNNLNIYNGVGWQPVQRRILLADLTIYVATTGSDTAGSGTSASPFKTIMKAINYIVAYIDASAYTVTIQIADGTYTEDVYIDETIYKVAPRLVLAGNLATPGNVIIQSTNTTTKNGITVAHAAVVLKGLTCIGASGLSAYRSYVTIVSACSFFGSYGALHINASRLYSPVLLTLGAVAGTANYLLIVEGGSVVGITSGFSVSGGNATIINHTVFVANISYLYLAGTLYGTVSGVKYVVEGMSMLRVNGAGVNYIPGTSAGATYNNSVYA